MPQASRSGDAGVNGSPVDYPEAVPPSAGPTRFAELNEVLGRLVDGGRRALGDNFVGAYLVGSFALGDADIHSDCDFIMATGGPIRPAQEEAIRRLHEGFPSDKGHWNQHLEGSYAPIDDLRRLDALGRDWLFVDHGHAEMEWSAHCNSPEHRWTLRHYGVVLAGPSSDGFAEVPSSLLRERMRSQVPGFMAELATWIRIEDIAWAQRYAVTTLCRMLFTVRHGTLASKRRALLWAAEELDPRWRDLVLRAERERVRGWDPGDLPVRELVEQTRQFVDYATVWVLPSAENAS